eukprot:Gb_39053 [translate_table: standard]
MTMIVCILKEYRQRIKVATHFICTNAKAFPKHTLDPPLKNEGQSISDVLHWSPELQRGFEFKDDGDEMEGGSMINSTYCAHGLGMMEILMEIKKLNTLSRSTWL